MCNLVVCISCRTAKQRCLNNPEGQQGQRCKSSGRPKLCEYIPLGTNVFHRKFKRSRPCEDAGEPPPGSRETFEGKRRGAH
jgi:hypothetical protein